MTGEIRITMTKDEERNGTVINANGQINNASLYDRFKLFDIMSRLLELEDSDLATYLVARGCGLFNDKESGGERQEIKISDAFKKFMKDRQEKEGE